MTFWNSDPTAPFWGAPSSLFWSGSSGDSVIYAYDALGRLTGMTFANGTSISYNYDANGNRTSVVTVCGIDGC